MASYAAQSDQTLLERVIDRHPCLTEPNTLLSEVLANFENTQNYALVVTDKRILGIFTQHDLCRLIATGQDYQNLAMAKVMTQPVLTTTLSEIRSIFTLLTLFRQNSIHHLPVLDDEQQLIGVITETSLLQSLDMIPALGTITELQTLLSKQSDDLQRYLTLFKGEMDYPQVPLETPRISQEFPQAIFEHTLDAIAIADDAGYLAEVNPSACKLFGLPQENLLGLSLADILEPGTDFQTFWQTSLNDLPLPREVQIRRHDGERRQVEYTLAVDFLPHRHLAILRDITERKQAEAALQLQHQRAELFAEVTLKIRQSLQLKEILQTTVTEVQRLLKADRVLIYQVLADGTGKAISEAVLPNYSTILDREFPPEVLPEDYQKHYAQGRVKAIVDVTHPDSGVADCLVEFVQQFQVRSKLIVPILQNLNRSPRSDNETDSTKLWGLLIAHQCDAARHWNEFEIELMQQLANQIGIALAQAQLLEQLEDKVQERTAELVEVNHNLEQEIRDRIQAEEALRRSEEQLRLITNALPVLISYVDKQQRFRFNNQAYEDWFGRSRQSLKGCHLKDLLGDATYANIQPFIKVALSGQSITYESEFTLKGDEIHSVTVTYIPHFQDLPKGHRKKKRPVKGFIALTTDISDRKAIERMKDEFLSVVSHELRTPLTSLHSALKILVTGRLGTLSDDGQQMLEIADDNTERLVRLVNNVLDLQRIESGEVNLEMLDCNVAELMVQATEAMQAMADQQNIQLQVHPIDLKIWADPDYMMQTLTNLLSNAIKFSHPNGTVWLAATLYKVSAPPKTRKKSSKAASKKATATAKSRSAQSSLNSSFNIPDALIKVLDRSMHYAVMHVRDQGQGIPADKLESIFERFQQVDSSDSRKKGGTGLGLTICRKIIEQHGGYIWADSELGNGSTFYVMLPLSKK